MAFTGKVRPQARAAVSELPGGDAAKTVHIGPYDNDEVAPQEVLRTEVYWPIAGA